MESARVFVMFFIVMATGMLAHDAFADSNNDAVMTSIEVTAIGLELTRNSLDSGNMEHAKKHSEFAADYFGKQVQALRTATGSAHIDEIHISLLDAAAKINSGTDATADVEKIQTLLRQIPYDQSALPDMVIVNLLAIADEKYQVGIMDDDEASYQLSRSLIQRADGLFAFTDFDQRLTLEVESFFMDLDEQTKARDEFIKIGGLITVIQRDILGTESLAFDQRTLYQTIRQLYDEMLAHLANGDYEAAEEKAITAYLDNFEYLEPAIDKVDKDLLYTLEINMREELRGMIQDKESPDKIRGLLKIILADLDRAEDMVSARASLDPDLMNPASAASLDGLKQMGDATDEEKTGVRAEVDYIRNSLLDVIVLYENGDYQGAYATARSAYLDSYEFVEIPLREIAPDFTLEVEYQFADLRNMIKERADPEKIKEVATAINRNLDESERLVSGTGTLAPSIAFLSSFAIIFREGLESVLILGAILAYLEASRNNRLKKYVYYGVAAAVGATGITWVIASYIIEISGANREMIEAIAALSATAVLFYVSFWVLNKIEHKKWMEFVKAKVWQATTTGSVMVFVMLAFFTVYREGFETVLFYQAMSGFAKYMEVYVGLGFVIGLASLFAIYYIMRKLGKKLPLRALFGLTMGVGAYLSIAFLGNAIRELQILDLLPYTSMIGVIPRLDINLATMTGIYPTLETVMGQMVLLGIYLGAASYILILRPKKEKQLAMMRKSRRREDGTA